MYFPIIINWTSPLPILGLLGDIFPFYSLKETSVSKQWKTWSDPPFCGVWCLPMSHKKDARLIWVNWITLHYPLLNKIYSDGLKLVSFFILHVAVFYCLLIYFFFKTNCFQKICTVNPQVSKVWIQIRPAVMSGLIWHSGSKQFAQTTLTGRE